MSAKKEKWKQEKTKYLDRIERLDVKVEALKEENQRLVVAETRTKGELDRRVSSSCDDHIKIQRYKDGIFYIIYIFVVIIIRLIIIYLFLMVLKKLNN